VREVQGVPAVVPAVEVAVVQGEELLQEAQLARADLPERPRPRPRQVGPGQEAPRAAADPWGRRRAPRVPMPALVSPSSSQRRWCHAPYDSGLDLRASLHLQEEKSGNQ